VALFRLQCLTRLQGEGAALSLTQYLVQRRGEGQTCHVDKPGDADSHLRSGNARSHYTRPADVGNAVPPIGILRRKTPPGDEMEKAK
jgi:hypothetical protein